MHEISRLPSGLTVVTAPMPHMTSVSVGLWVAVGGRFEPAPVNGVAHFIEHMLFKGTHKRSALEISEAVEGIGGYLNAFTTEEHTCFYARAGADHFEHVLEVLMDMFLHSAFDRGEIEKEREVIREELAMYLDQPHQHVQELMNETLWPNHPLGRPLTGSEHTLRSLQRKQMVDYQRRNYVAPACLLATAGNVTHARVVKAMRRFARAFPPGTPPSFLPLVADQREPRVRLATREITQLALSLGFRTCSRHDERRFAIRMLNAILGENMSSRLFQVLREDHGLAYSINSGVTFFDDTGMVEIAAGIDTDKLRKALPLILKELQRCKERPATRLELRRARDYLIGQLDLSLEGTENQMNWLGEQMLAFGRVMPSAEIKRQLCAVTAGHIRQVARDFFTPDRVSLALVSPKKSTHGLAKMLGKSLAR